MRCKACNSLIFWTLNRDDTERLIDPDLCDNCNTFVEVSMYSDIKDYVHGYTTKNNITLSNTSFTDED